MSFNIVFICCNISGNHYYAGAKYFKAGGTMDYFEGQGTHSSLTTLAYRGYRLLKKDPFLTIHCVLCTHCDKLICVQTLLITNGLTT